MTKNMQSGAKRQNFSFLFLIPVICLLFSACTATRPPGYQLPSRNSIQAGGDYIVGQNENVYRVAHKNGVSMRELIVLNDLKPPFVLHQGQRLILPAKNQDNAPVPQAAPRDGIEQTPLEPAAGGAASQAVTSTPLEPPQVLPPSPPPLSAPPAPPKPVATTVTPTLSPVAPKPATPPPAQTAAVEKPAVSFAWPVQGPILSAFGSKGQGLNNDGINIAAPKGAPVVAAGGGIVVYAGNEMKGFGNLVLIRHEGGWVTAYAHLDRMMVNKDTVVAPGDMIGTVGSTGGVTTPQLHFETRLEGKPIDPQTVIKGAS
jgi:murein DD-endopeptidase MepM/ murein hydrolase activator NlpD